jgi:methyl-accepting chemotaxis protein
MKKLLNLIVILALVLSIGACTTTSFAGLAKSSYVEEIDTAAGQTRSELEELQREVAEMKDLADQLESIIAAMEETRKATEELQVLAGVVEDRLESLPRETLRLLAQTIETFLKE